MLIRTFEPGDEEQQLAVYNAAASSLPGFKAATLGEIQRRTTSRDFDPRTRWYAIVQGQVVGYCSWSPTGRISYPWHLPGYEAVAEPLFHAVLAELRQQGITRIFAAYRKDWDLVGRFFEQQGFTKRREFLNYAQPISELPTMVLRRGVDVRPIQNADVPAIAELGKDVLRVTGPQLEKYLFQNPYFPPASVSVLQSLQGEIQGVGLLIDNVQYAQATRVDVLAPCFRLGAFGTEELSTKRINGLFSFLAAPQANPIHIALDLLWTMTQDVDDSRMPILAAQVPSDAPHLHYFYEKFFRFQGSFPIYERTLT